MTLHEYLAANQMKPSAFAAKAGLPASTITRILNGERQPGLDVMKAVRDATDGQVQPNDFLDALPTPTSEVVS